jgi:hypothetical protein
MTDLGERGPEAMPNSVNCSTGSFKQKGLWERYDGGRIIE